MSRSQPDTGTRTILTQDRLGDFPMKRRVLKGIKVRAERMSAGPELLGAGWRVEGHQLGIEGSGGTEG
jgi:hypothetical protein